MSVINAMFNTESTDEATLRTTRLDKNEDTLINIAKKTMPIERDEDAEMSSLRACVVIPDTHRHDTWCEIDGILARLTSGKTSPANYL